jgi:hypothetical protein
MPFSYKTLLVGMDERGKEKTWFEIFFAIRFLGDIVSDNPSYTI